MLVSLTVRVNCVFFNYVGILRVFVSLFRNPRVFMGCVQYDTFWLNEEILFGSINLENMISKVYATHMFTLASISSKIYDCS